jgi:hypothetical protein
VGEWMEVGTSQSFISQQQQEKNPSSMKDKNDGG